MSWRTVLQRVHDFAVSNPQRLREQLEAFERSIAAVVAELRTVLGNPGAPRRITSGGAIIQPNECVICDTTSGSFEVLLPSPAKSPSRLRTMPFCVIIKPTASNSLVVRPLESATINGAATITLSSLAAYDIFDDGANFWREF